MRKVNPPPIAYENNTSHKSIFAASVLPSPAVLYLDNLAPGSRRAMAGALERIAGLLVCQDELWPPAVDLCPYTLDRRGNPIADIGAFPWAVLRREHTATLRARLTARYAPATVNRMLSALRGVLREAWRLGQLNAETYRRAADISGVSGETVPAGRALTGAEVEALFDACALDHSPAGTRDAAVLALLIGCGLRRGEVVQLKLTDYDAAANALTVRQAKRNRPRTVYPEGGAAAALGDWLHIRGDRPGAVFVPINKAGRLLRGRLNQQGELLGLSRQAIYDLIGKRAAEARIANVTPHDLRRTFISNLLETTDIATVQQLAGHANVATTARYDRRPEERRRQAVRTLHIPYKRAPWPKTR